MGPRLILIGPSALHEQKGLSLATQNKVALLMVDIKVQNTVRTIYKE